MLSNNCMTSIIFSNRFQVCELHFPKEDILKHSEYFDEKSGRKVVAPLYIPRLRAESVPSVFPNYPKYLTVTKSKREDPEARRTRLENSALSAAISNSLSTYKQFEETRSFTTFNEFIDCLEKEKFSESWTIVKKKECVLFVFIDTSNFVPFLAVSASVNSDLEINVFRQQTALRTPQYHAEDLLNVVNYYALHFCSETMSATVYCKLINFIR